MYNENKPQSESQVMTEEEFKFVQGIVKANLNTNKELKYEKLDDYEVPVRTQFSILKKPSVTISRGYFKFNNPCIRLFEGVQHVLLIVNSKQHKMAVIPCADEEMSSIEWSRKRAKDNLWVSKEITNKDLFFKISEFMQWPPECRFRTIGEVRMSSKGPILVFELDEAVMYSTTKIEVVDESTGERKAKYVSDKFLPSKYRGKIGMTYGDYMHSRQMSLLEDFSEYIDQPTKTMLDYQSSNQQ